MPADLTGANINLEINKRIAVTWNRAMHSELSVWRPLIELSVIVVILGVAGCVASRDRQSWWLSHGLVVLGLLIGLATAAELHSPAPLMSLMTWMLAALLIEGAV